MSSLPVELTITSGLFFFVSIIVPILVSVGVLTLTERQVMASIQRRSGPNVIGYRGLLQPLADGLKLFLKESVSPYNANTALYFIAPVCSLTTSLTIWSFIPFGYGYVVADPKYGVLCFMVLSSLGAYGILIAGWSSNSKYAFLGALRSAAQMISYELSMALCLSCVSICTRSANLTSIVMAQKVAWLAVIIFPVFIIFFICCLAETNRHPFDLPEAEAELVAGYNVEYSGIGFTLFFLAEYSNILAMCAMTTILFFGGWLDPFGIIPPFICFSLKTVFFVLLFIYTRALLPRYRYDQLMTLGWKSLLPASLSLWCYVENVSMCISSTSLLILQ